MRLLFLILLVAGSLLALAASAAPLDKVHPSLQARMMAAGEQELIPVMIDLGERFDTKSFRQRTEGFSKEERRALLIKEASAFAEEQQASLLAVLKDAEAGGFASRVKGLWIVNMIIGHVSKDVIQQLAGEDAVSMISWDRPFGHELLHDAIDDPGDGPPAVVSWSVSKINAPKVWQLGITGHGAVIANLDSGTDYNHPDLSDHIWNNADEIPNNGKDDDNNGYVDDTMGWDFENNDKDPMDSYGHGTSTAGVAVGDGTNGTQTGVAPDAELMICRISGEGLHIAAQEYAIENGANVVTSSYSYKWGIHDPDYHVFRKLRPEALDDWTHWLHDPSGTSLSSDAVVGSLCFY